MGLIKYIGSTLLVTLFAIAIISYTQGFASDNSAPINLNDDSRISATNLKSDITNLNVQANSSSSSYTEGTAEAGDQSEESGGTFKVLTSTYGSMKRVLGLGEEVIFGGDQSSSSPGLVITALGSFLLVVWVLYNYKAWRGKDPD